jgi:hypothetical protein
MRNAFQIPVSLYGLALPGNAWFLKSTLHINVNILNPQLVHST